MKVCECVDKKLTVYKTKKVICSSFLIFFVFFCFLVSYKHSKYGAYRE